MSEFTYPSDAVFATRLTVSRNLLKAEMHIHVEGERLDAQGNRQAVTATVVMPMDAGAILAADIIQHVQEAARGQTPN